MWASEKAGLPSPSIQGCSEREYIIYSDGIVERSGGSHLQKTALFLKCMSGTSSVTPVKSGLEHMLCLHILMPVSG